MWEYIVAFVEVLTMYQIYPTWIHPLHCSLSSPAIWLFLVLEPLFIIFLATVKLQYRFFEHLILYGIAFLGL
jgi:hypothetical protein